jgi:hypothetical protein
LQPLAFFGQSALLVDLRKVKDWEIESGEWREAGPAVGGKERIHSRKAQASRNISRGLEELDTWDSGLQSFRTWRRKEELLEVVAWGTRRNASRITGLLRQTVFATTKLVVGKRHEKGHQELLHWIGEAVPDRYERAPWKTPPSTNITFARDHHYSTSNINLAMIPNMSSTASPQEPRSGPLRTLENLSSSWQQRKQYAAIPQRLVMRLLEVIALAGAMFIVPTSIHRAVQSVDEVYELLGRRARSPYGSSSSWMSVIVAAVLLTGWHVWLGRLSHKAILEDESEVSKERRSSSWGRILGRIVVPLLLLSFGVHFSYQLLDKFVHPAPFITPNVNGGREIQW